MFSSVHFLLVHSCYARIIGGPICNWTRKERCRAEGLCLLQQSGRLATDSLILATLTHYRLAFGAASDTLMTSQLNNRRSALWKVSRLAASDFPGSPDITRPITAMLRGDTSNG